jgi:methylmalonyl-CoA epimerase
MIRRIDHIAIGVRDLEKAKTFFIEKLGGRELFSAPVPLQGYRATTLELGTSCFLELLNPLETKGFLHRFLDSRGEGPHHITIQVEDIQRIVRVLEEKEIPTFGYSEALPGWKEVFVHPQDAFGTLLQFAEFNPLDWINPGYIPPSYREFAPAEQPGSAEAPVEVRLLDERVEVTCAGEGVRFPRSEIPKLIQMLQAVESAPPGSNSD